MKKNVKRNLKENGITLIALIVTIIILLILAGVTLNFVLGENGLVKSAQNASDLFAKRSDAEKLEMIKSEWEIGLITGKGENLEDFLTELKNNGSIDDFENLGDGVYTIKRSRANTVIQNGEVTTWDGETVSTELAGEGTEEKPFVIKNGEDFMFLQNAIKNGDTTYTFANFKQVKDIELNDTSDFEQWRNDGYNRSALNNIYSDSDRSFFGKYDGDGHTISGLYIDAGNNPAGLFKFCHSAIIDNNYVTQCEIKNLNVQKAYVKGGSDVGIIAGYASKVNFTNCHVSGYVEGQSMVGGMAGILSTSEGASVVNCSSSATVKGNYYCAGLLSKASGPITIENCSNSGNIFGYQTVSGIVGEGFSNNDKLILKNCRNTGKLESTENNYYSYFGGIVGSLGGSALVDSCTNEGEVVVGEATNRYQIGGAFGLASGRENSAITIQNCTNTGNVRTTFNEAGGLIGDTVAHNEAEAGYVVIRNCNNTGKRLPQQTDLPLVGAGYYTEE